MLKKALLRTEPNSMMKSKTKFRKEKLLKRSWTNKRSKESRKRKNSKKKEKEPKKRREELKTKLERRPLNKQKTSSIEPLS
jgi:hypothetical protein